MNKKRTKNNSILLGIILGILMLVFLTALAVGILLSTDLLYKIDIDVLHIEQESGLQKEVILSNYNAVIEYLNPFNNYSFNMPSLEASEGGVNHFSDVKNIVNYLYIGGIVSLALILLLLLILKDKTGSRTLGVVSITMLLVPIICVAAIALDFDGFFILFHELFFSNDDWMFDYITDPVITILPAEYFMHCAIVIAVFWLLGSLTFLILSKKNKKKNKSVSTFLPRY